MTGTCLVVNHVSPTDLKQKPCIFQSQIVDFPHMVFFILMDALDQLNLCCGDCLVQYRLFINDSALYQLRVRGNSLSPRLGSTHCLMFLGESKIFPADLYYYTVTHRQNFICFYLFFYLDNNLEA